MSYVSSITIADGLVSGIALTPINTLDVTSALGYTPLSGNQNITLTGDATGSGTTSIAVTLANSGASAGNWGSPGSGLGVALTVDAKGRITSISQPSIAIVATQITGGTLSVPRGGTGNNASVVTGNCIMLSLTSPITGMTEATALTSGQVLIGSTGAAPVAAALAAGTGISVTNGAGSITVAMGSSGVVAGSYGSATAWPTFTVDATGRVTAAGTQTLTFDNSICDGRLTLTSGSPVTASDVTGATTIYFSPYRGNRIALWNGSTWIVDTFSETSLALGTLTNALPYDVFALDNAGTLNLEKLAWTSATARATDVTLQDGVYCKSGDKTRRYLGTFYTSSTTTTEDSAAKRFVWNYRNRVRRALRRQESTASWTYAVASYRYANNSSTNRVEFVIGVQDAEVSMRLNEVATGTSAVVVINAIGLDASTAPATNSSFGQQQCNASGSSVVALYEDYPAIGYHFLAWLELASGGTATLFGGNPGYGGLFGFVDA